MAKPNRARAPSSRVRFLVPKITGADVELGNFVTGRGGAPPEGASASSTTGAGSGREASRALLAEIEGLPKRAAPLASSSPAASDRRYGGWYGSTYGSGYGAGYGSAYGAYGREDPQDIGRQYLASNGGCAYIDLDHLELCIPEVRCARDHVAALHAMFRIARRAQENANAKRGGDEPIQVLANNSDGQGQSYGGHLNVLVSRQAWENLFHRKLHYALFLASFQASAIVLTGQGKVGSENDAPAVPFQISQRADFIETLSGPQTTYHRPIVNTRDEALCGERDRWRDDSRGQDHRFARLHVISFDTTLNHVSMLLRVGLMQLVSALIEAEAVRVERILEDPVEAFRSWSHDPDLGVRARLVSGGAVTAVELQLQFLEDAGRFLERCDVIEEIVPGAREIVQLWSETLDKLGRRDFDALRSELDWVQKRALLDEVVSSEPRLGWDSPAIKHLDLVYASLDPEGGIFWALDRAGLSRRLVGDDEIDRFVREPPPDTRAWTRAMLLRRAGERVTEVDWDRVQVRGGGSNGRSRERVVRLDRPAQRGEARTGAAFAANESLSALLDALHAEDVPDRGWGNSLLPVHGTSRTYGR